MEFNSHKKILQNIFRSYFPRMKNMPLPLKDIKAAEAIMNCRTLEQGYDYLSCPEGHEDKIQLHSCRHRSCSICADKARHEWVDAQRSRLLGCSHYHVIFTLPHEYLALWQCNRKWFTTCFFKACRDTLITLLEDKKYLGATPGILMTLHTWGRQLNYHPHIHCLVTAGGMTNEKQWKALERDFLLPIRVVKTLFRGKLQSEIKSGLEVGDVRLPHNVSLKAMLSCYRCVYKKQWGVRIQEKYTHGKGVMLYLARYMKGGPIKPQQIISCTNGITFMYKDHRDQKIKSLTLSIDAFVRRILWHVPEIGVHVVRHYGLYSSNNKKKRNACREVIGGLYESSVSAGKKVASTLDCLCAVCGARLRKIFSTFQMARYENSYKESQGLRSVQQCVQADIKNPFHSRDPCIP